MEKKFKTQVLTVSKRFLSGNPKAGEPTKFRDKILRVFDCPDCKGNEIGVSDYCNGCRTERKRHTVRDNYPYWADVIERNMLLSIRQWIDKPYKKPGQENIIDIEPGKWGIQRITMINGQNGLEAFVNEKSIDIDTLAANDGLSRTDFATWFAPHFKRKNIFYGVVIHFTDFRY